MKFGLKLLLRYFASKAWNMMPTEIKDSTRVEVFLKKNKLESSDCDCKLCQDYLDSIG